MTKSDNCYRKLKLFSQRVTLNFAVFSFWTLLLFTGEIYSKLFSVREPYIYGSYFLFFMAGHKSSLDTNIYISYIHCASKWMYTMAFSSLALIYMLSSIRKESHSVANYLSWYECNFLCPYSRGSRWGLLYLCFLVEEYLYIIYTLITKIHLVFSTSGFSRAQYYNIPVQSICLWYIYMRWFQLSLCM